MLQGGGSSSSEGKKKKKASIFKSSTHVFPVRNLEVGEAAAGVWRRPLLQTNMPNCSGKAVRGSSRKNREVAAAGRGCLWEANRKRLKTRQSQEK